MTLAPKRSEKRTIQSHSYHSGMYFLFSIKHRIAHICDATTILSLAPSSLLSFYLTHSFKLDEMLTGHAHQSILIIHSTTDNDSDNKYHQ